MLVEAEVVGCTEGVGSKCPKEYRMHCSFLTRGQLQSALESNANEWPSSIMKWYFWDSIRARA